MGYGVAQSLPTKSPTLDSISPPGPVGRSGNRFGYRGRISGSPGSHRTRWPPCARHTIGARLNEWRSPAAVERDGREQPWLFLQGTTTCQRPTLWLGSVRRTARTRLKPLGNVGLCLRVRWRPDMERRENQGTYHCISQQNDNLTVLDSPGIGRIQRHTMQFQRIGHLWRALSPYVA